MSIGKFPSPQIFRLTRSGVLLFYEPALQAFPIHCPLDLSLPLARRNLRSAGFFVSDPMTHPHPRNRKVPSQMSDIPQSLDKKASKHLHDRGIEMTPDEVNREGTTAFAKIREAMAKRGFTLPESDMELIAFLREMQDEPAAEPPTDA